MNASWQKQLDEHRGKRKEEIIDAAEALFMEQELTKVTMKDIAGCRSSVPCSSICWIVLM